MLQKREDPIKEGLALLPTKEPKLLVLSSFQLLLFDIVIKADKVEGHKNSPTISMKLGD